MAHSYDSLCWNSLRGASLRLLADKVRIASRLRILPEARLKVLHNIIGVPQRVASIQLATPPLLRGTRVVRDERNGLGDASLLSDGHVLGVDLSFAGAVPVVVRVLLEGGRHWSLDGLWADVGELRLLHVLSLLSHISRVLGEVFDGGHESRLDGGGEGWHCYRGDDSAGWEGRRCRGAAGLGQRWAEGQLQLQLAAARRCRCS